MIMIQLMGGLGNQMFQYALYRQLQAMGKKVTIEDMTGYEAAGVRQKQLSVFGIHYEKASREEFVALTDAYMDTVSRVRRKLFGRKTFAYMEKQFNFDNHVFKLEQAYLEGCWQSEKYFKGVEGQLRKDFCFPTPMPEHCLGYRDGICNTESVSIHIRRGDYLQAEQNRMYGGICTQDYYDRAVEYMKSHFPGCSFYVFSNDPDWAGAHYTGKAFTIVTGNGEDAGYLDMQLMSLCKHNIIANSSFSWWAAWLNANPQKVVLAPDQWLNGQDCSDIYTDRMLAI